VIAGRSAIHGRREDRLSAKPSGQRRSGLNGVSLERKPGKLDLMGIGIDFGKKRGKGKGIFLEKGNAGSTDLNGSARNFSEIRAH
jgi:hypothetical protein